MREETIRALNESGELGERIKAEILNHLDPPPVYGRCVLQHICMGFNESSCTKEAGDLCEFIIIPKSARIEGFCRMCSNSPEDCPPVGYNGVGQEVCVLCAILLVIELSPNSPKFRTIK